MPETTPAQVVKKVVGMLAAGSDDIDVIAKRYLSKRAWHKAGESSVKAALKSMGQASRSSTVSPEVVGDS